MYSYHTMLKDFERIQIYFLDCLGYISSISGLVATYSPLLLALMRYWDVKTHLREKFSSWASTLAMLCIGTIGSWPGSILMDVLNSPPRKVTTESLLPESLLPVLLLRLLVSRTAPCGGFRLSFSLALVFGGIGFRVTIIFTLFVLCVGYGMVIRCKRFTWWGHSKQMTCSGDFGHKKCRCQEKYKYATPTLFSKIHHPTFVQPRNLFFYWIKSIKIFNYQS